jgi:hypothetical protein
MPASDVRPAPRRDHNYRLNDNAVLYDPKQVEEYFQTLFRNVDWNESELISVLGIGEKGTAQEGAFRERKIVPPSFVGSVHTHFKRWGEHQVASFVVPAVLSHRAGEAGDVTRDKVLALTAIILDLDSGDTDKKAAYVAAALGQPSMVVASGGLTDEGTPKLHLYWLFNEASEEVDRVAELRKTLAAKVGGDQSFGRATQVVRVAGTVHAKNGKASACRILSPSDMEYSLDELAEIIEAMQPMPGVEPPKPRAELPGMLPGGIMDFTPRADTAVAALHRDVHEGGEELTRWGEFNKVAGFQIAEARAGRIDLPTAYNNTCGWMLQHMKPEWPLVRFDTEFRALFEVDVKRHGPFPQRLAPPAGTSARKLPVERFSEIEASLTNIWLVRNWIPAAAVALIYGNPGSGKSFLAIDIAIKIAAGWDVNGAKVRQGLVLYIAAEGATGVRNRIAAFRMHHSIGPEVPFSLIPVAIDLLDPSTLPLLCAAIDEEIAHYGCAPVAIFVDTLAATFGGGDENGPDMAAYLGNCAQVRDRYGATVVAIHHRPKDQTNNTPRGHGSLWGGLDASVLVERSEKLCIASTRKQKDGPDDGAPLAFELCQIELGLDEDGLPVTSAIVKYKELRFDGKLSANAKLVLQALTNAIERGGRDDASEREWREAWEELTEGRQEEARRKAFNRGRKQLVALELIEGKAGRWSVIEQKPPDSPPMDFVPE